MMRALTPIEYRLLVEHSPVMIWRSGVDTSCDYFNEPWLRFTGRTLQQEMGNGWTEGVHRDDLSRCVSHYLDHFKRRAPFEMEYRLRRHDGVYRWIFDRGVPFSDETGTFAGFIGSCVDVDERRRMQEAQQRRTEEQLSLSHDFEKWVLAIVGHDIRDPLNAIQAAALALSHLSDPSGMISRNAETVIRGVNRIQHIVGDLLDLSRVREGAGIGIDPEPTDLRAICQRIIEESKATAHERAIAFHCEADGRGAWDEHRILQALSNLISNAVQHGTPGSPVRVRLTGDEQRVCIEVRNDGTVPDELLPRIFEPFRAGRHRGKRADGLGLGLFIAKAIAHAHDGALELSSAEGITTARLVLPRRTSSNIPP